MMNVDEEDERSVAETQRLMKIFSDLRERRVELQQENARVRQMLGMQPRGEELPQSLDEIPPEKLATMEKVYAAFEASIEDEIEAATKRFRAEILKQAEELKKVAKKRIRNMI